MQYSIILLQYFVMIINNICFTFFPGLKQLPSQHTLNTPVDTPLPPNTPSQKLQQQFFPSSMSMDMDSHRNSTIIPNRHSRYGSSADINGFSTLGTTRSYRTANFNNFSTSCDPLKDLG